MLRNEEIVCWVHITPLLVWQCNLNEFLGHGDEENGPPRVAFDLNEFPEPEDDEI